MTDKQIETRGFLMHVSHYDPSWCARKDREEPFDLDVGKRVVEAMAEQGMNLLVVDCADGVRYRSHPELERHYTVPMEMLRELADCAHERGIDVAPKLNFAKSGRNRHDMWMAPHSDLVAWRSGLEKYWQVAKDLIAELVETCRPGRDVPSGHCRPGEHPGRYFHVGMDEDHYRSLPQFVQDIVKLRGLVSEHDLTTVIWSDSCYDYVETGAQVHALKCLAAEPLLPTDLVQVLWDYDHAHPAGVRRRAEGGFTVWAAPGHTPEKVAEWRKAVVENGGSGLLMTCWIKCCRRNEDKLLGLVRGVGGMYA